MEIKINAIHFDATEKLNDFINKKVEKLGKYNEEISNAEVILKARQVASIVWMSPRRMAPISSWRS